MTPAVLVALGIAACLVFFLGVCAGMSLAVRVLRWAETAPREVLDRWVRQ